MQNRSKPVCRADHTARRWLVGRLATFLTTAGLTLLSGPLCAQGVPARTVMCAACHGVDGNSVMPQSPSLAGQPRVFLENQLVIMREGLRKIPAMQGMLDGVKDDEIVALARYFSALPLKPAPGALEPARMERGAALAARTHCASCHLPSYAGREQMPRLAGQREDYLMHSMKQFLDGTASGRDTIMAASLHGMSQEDLRDLAHFFSQMK